MEEKVKNAAQSLSDIKERQSLTYFRALWTGSPLQKFRLGDFAHFFLDNFHILGQIEQLWRDAAGVPFCMVPRPPPTSHDFKVTHPPPQGSLAPLLKIITLLFLTIESPPQLSNNCAVTK
jgi:hypothetical protein